MIHVQDTPMGDLRTQKKNGTVPTVKGNSLSVMKAAFLNYRSWILAMTYGYSFGVELTVDNIIVSYLYDQVRPHS